MAHFALKSRGEKYVVYIDDKDVERVENCARTDAGSGRNDFSRPLCVWRILWKDDKIDAVVASVPIGFRKTRQVKLYDLILGDTPKCKAVRFRDGNPLNNFKENLALYQAYKVEDIKNMPPKRSVSYRCLQCKNNDTCTKVITRKIRRTGYAN